MPELHEAVMDGDKEKVGRLIKEGADIDELAAIFGRGGRETPLCLAAHAGNREIVEILIANGADVNKECPLRYAVRGNFKDIAIILMDNGADVNRSRNGNIPLPLIAAASNGSAEMLQLLIDRGLDVLAEDKDPFSPIPINVATFFGNREVVEMLLAQGVNINCKEQTPLHVAASMGNGQIAGLLLVHEADINAKDEAGKTPLDVATEHGQKAMVLVLHKQGAKHSTDLP